MNMTTRVLIVLASLVMSVTLVQARTLYKWVDEDGSVSYHDRPAPEGGGYRTETKRFKDSDGPVKEELRDIARRNPIVIYLTSTCQTCATAKDYLNKREFPFQEKNVEGNPDLIEELRRVSGGLTVPVITIGGKVIKGYAQGWLESELTQAGYPAPVKPGQAEQAEQTENQ